MKRFNITVNGKAYDVTVEEAGSAPVQTVAPVQTAAPVQAAAPIQAAPKAAVPAGGTPVKAPMSGNILEVKASVGDTVKTGQVLFVLEALKMENDIVANADGKLSSINVKKGDTVNTDDVLAVIG